MALLDQKRSRRGLDRLPLPLSPGSSLLRLLLCFLGRSSSDSFLSTSSGTSHRRLVRVSSALLLFLHHRLGLEFLVALSPTVKRRADYRFDLPDRSGFSSVVVFASWPLAPFSPWPLDFILEPPGLWPESV